MADHIRHWPPRALNEPDADYYVSLSVATLRSEVDAYLDRLAGRTAPAGDNDWQRLFDSK